MSETMQDALAPVLVRWTMGGNGAGAAPDWLKEHLGDDPDEAELRLLAVAGPALAMLVVPEPEGLLKDIPEIPVLPLPTIAERLRPLTGRVLSKANESLRTGLLRLIEARGHVVHPADWMPARNGDVPGIYAPWQDWISGIATDVASREPTWEYLGTAGRKALLARLRKEDPAKALSLVTEAMANEPADVRLWLVQSLSTGLSTDDRDFLMSMTADRAPRVRSAVSRMLARLGSAPRKTDDDVEDPVSQVPDFLVVKTSGMLRREKTISIVRPSSHIQITRRSEMMSNIDAAGLAEGLGVTDVDLPALWPWKADIGLDQAFGSILLETGRNEVVAALSSAIVDGMDVPGHALANGAERLSEEALARIATNALVHAGALEHMLGRLPIAGLVDTYKRSDTWIRIVQGLSQDDRPVAYTEDLHALGAIVTARAAREIIDALMSMGIPSADPRLDTLRINAAL